MTITRRRTLALGASSLGGLVLPAAGARTVKFRYVTPFNFSLSYSAVFHAKTGGFFEREGLDVEVINGRGAALASTLVIAGQAEVARTGGANYIVSKVESDAPLIAIATIAQVSPFYLISAPAGPLRRPADMKGRTIGVASLGGSMENTLALTLRSAQVDPASVERVKVADVPASYGLIEAKRIDGFLASISSTAKILAAVPAAIATAIDDGLPGQVLVATPSALEKNEDAYVRFLRAVHRSASAILDAPDLAPIIKAIGSGFEIPGLDDTATAIRDLTQNAQSWIAKGRANLLRSVPEQWAAAAAIMHETAMLRRAVDPASLYTNALRDKAVA